MENKLTSHGFLPQRRNYSCKQESQALLKDTRGKTKFCVINLKHVRSYKVGCNMCLLYPFGIIGNWDGGDGRMHHHQHSLLSLQVALPYSDTSTTDEFKQQARIRGVKRKSFHASSQILTWQTANPATHSGQRLSPAQGFLQLQVMPACATCLRVQIPASPDRHVDSTVSPQRDGVAPK